MFTYYEREKNGFKFQTIAALLILALVGGQTFGPGTVYAQTLVMPPSAGLLSLPAPGTLVQPSLPFTPLLLKGITVHPENPLEFDFIIDRGDSSFENDQQYMKSVEKQIKYFLTSLTIPSDELWVNLSPYEGDRIIPGSFGETAMGRDSLSQDYILKQLTASLMYPEEQIGEKVWARIYNRMYEEYQTTRIPVNTFNKVWIVPEKAVVFEKNNNAFVVESKLKVMLEKDYQALFENIDSDALGMKDMKQKDVQEIDSNFSDVIREIIIPEIEHEVNHGKNFAAIRQILNALILADWYKKNLRKTILGQVYVDQNKTKGIDIEDKQFKQKIYDQYVEAFRKGVFNYIKKDYDPNLKEMIPRKYFSGGVKLIAPDDTQIIKEDETKLTKVQRQVIYPDDAEMARQLRHTTALVEFTDTNATVARSVPLATVPQQTITPARQDATEVPEFLSGRPFTGDTPMEITPQDAETIAQTSRLRKFWTLTIEKIKGPWILRRPDGEPTSLAKTLGLSALILTGLIGSQLPGVEDSGTQLAFGNFWYYFAIPFFEFFDVKRTMIRRRAAGIKDLGRKLFFTFIFVNLARYTITDPDRRTNNPRPTDEEAQGNIFGRRARLEKDYVIVEKGMTAIQQFISLNGDNVDQKKMGELERVLQKIITGSRDDQKDKRARLDSLLERIDQAYGRKRALRMISSHPDQGNVAEALRFIGQQDFIPSQEDRYHMIIEEDGPYQDVVQNADTVLQNLIERKLDEKEKAQASPAIGMFDDVSLKMMENHVTQAGVTADDVETFIKTAESYALYADHPQMVYEHLSETSYIEKIKDFYEKNQQAQEQMDQVVKAGLLDMAWGTVEQIDEFMHSNYKWILTALFFTMAFMSVIQARVRIEIYRSDVPKWYRRIWELSNLTSLASFLVIFWGLGTDIVGANIQYIFDYSPPYYHTDPGKKNIYHPPGDKVIPPDLVQRGGHKKIGLYITNFVASEGKDRSAHLNRLTEYLHYEQVIDDVDLMKIYAWLIDDPQTLTIANQFLSQPGKAKFYGIQTIDKNSVNFLNTGLKRQLLNDITIYIMKLSYPGLSFDNRLDVYKLLWSMRSAPSEIDEFHNLWIVDEDSKPEEKYQYLREDQQRLAARQQSTNNGSFTQDNEFFYYLQNGIENGNLSLISFTEEGESRIFRALEKLDELPYEVPKGFVADQEMQGYLDVEGIEIPVGVLAEQEAGLRYWIVKDPLKLQDSFEEIEKQLQRGAQGKQVINTYSKEQQLQRFDFLAEIDRHVNKIPKSANDQADTSLIESDLELKELITSAVDAIEQGLKGIDLDDENLSKEEKGWNYNLYAKYVFFLAVLGVIASNKKSRRLGNMARKRIIKYIVEGAKELQVGRIREEREMSYRGAKATLFYLLAFSAGISALMTERENVEREKSLIPSADSYEFHTGEDVPPVLTEATVWRLISRMRVNPESAINLMGELGAGEALYDLAGLAVAYEDYDPQLSKLALQMIDVILDVQDLPPSEQMEVAKDFYKKYPKMVSEGLMDFWFTATNNAFESISNENMRQVLVKWKLEMSPDQIQKAGEHFAQMEAWRQEAGVETEEEFDRTLLKVQQTNPELFNKNLQAVTRLIAYGKNNPELQQNEEQLKQWEKWYDQIQSDRTWEKIENWGYVLAAGAAALALFRYLPKTFVGRYFFANLADDDIPGVEDFPLEELDKISEDRESPQNPYWMKVGLQQYLILTQKAWKRNEETLRYRNQVQQLMERQQEIPDPPSPTKDEILQIRDEWRDRVVYGRLIKKTTTFEGFKKVVSDMIEAYPAYYDILIDLLKEMENIFGEKGYKNLKEKVKTNGKEIKVALNKIEQLQAQEKDPEQMEKKLQELKEERDQIKDRLEKLDRILPQSKDISKEVSSLKWIIPLYRHLILPLDADPANYMARTMHIRALGYTKLQEAGELVREAITRKPPEDFIKSMWQARKIRLHEHKEAGYDRDPAAVDIMSPLKKTQEKKKEHSTRIDHLTRQDPVNAIRAFWSAGQSVMSSDDFEELFEDDQDEILEKTNAYLQESREKAPSKQEGEKQRSWPYRFGRWLYHDFLELDKSGRFSWVLIPVTIGLGAGNWSCSSTFRSVKPVDEIKNETKKPFIRNDEVAAMKVLLQANARQSGMSLMEADLKASYETREFQGWLESLLNSQPDSLPTVGLDAALAYSQFIGLYDQQTSIAVDQGMDWLRTRMQNSIEPLEFRGNTYSNGNKAFDEVVLPELLNWVQHPFESIAGVATKYLIVSEADDATVGLRWILQNSDNTTVRARILQILALRGDGYDDCMNVAIQEDVSATERKAALQGLAWMAGGKIDLADSQLAWLTRNLAEFLQVDADDIGELRLQIAWNGNPEDGKAKRRHIELEGYFRFETEEIEYDREFGTPGYDPRKFRYESHYIDRTTDARVEFEDGVLNTLLNRIVLYPLGVRNPAEESLINFATLPDQELPELQQEAIRQLGLLDHSPEALLALIELTEYKDRYIQTLAQETFDATTARVDLVDQALWDTYQYRHPNAFVKIGQALGNALMQAIFQYAEMDRTGVNEIPGSQYIAGSSYFLTEAQERSGLEAAAEAVGVGILAEAVYEVIDRSGVPALVEIMFKGFGSEAAVQSREIKKIKEKAKADDPTEFWLFMMTTMADAANPRFEPVFRVFIGNDDIRVRAQAVRGLRRINAPIPMGGFIKELQSDNLKKSTLAAKVLAEVATLDAQNALETGLFDGNRDIRSDVSFTQKKNMIWGLARIAAQSQPDLPDAWGAIEDKELQSEEWKQAQAKALKAIGQAVTYLERNLDTRVNEALLHFVWEQLQKLSQQVSDVEIRGQILDVLSGIAEFEISRLPSSETGQVSDRIHVPVTNFGREVDPDSWIKDIEDVQALQGALTRSFYHTDPASLDRQIYYLKALGQMARQTEIDSLVRTQIADTLVQYAQQGALEVRRVAEDELGLVDVKKFTELYNGRVSLPAIDDVTKRTIVLWNAAGDRRFVYIYEGDDGQQQLRVVNFDEKLKESTKARQSSTEILWAARNCSYLDVQKAAINALGSLPTPSSLNVLLEIAADDNSQASGYAVEILMSILAQTSDPQLQEKIIGAIALRHDYWAIGQMNVHAVRKLAQQMIQELNRQEKGDEFALDSQDRSQKIAIRLRTMWRSWIDQLAWIVNWQNGEPLKTREMARQILDDLAEGGGVSAEERMRRERDAGYDPFSENLALESSDQESPLVVQAERIFQTEAMQEITDHQFLKALLRNPESTKDYLDDLLSHRNPSVQKIAVYAAQLLDPADERVTASLRASLFTGRNMEVFSAKIGALITRGADAKELKDRLIAVLRSENRPLAQRINAAYGIGILREEGKIQRDDIDAVAALMHYLDHQKYPYDLRSETFLALDGFNFRNLIGGELDSLSSEAWNDFERITTHLVEDTTVYDVQGRPKHEIYGILSIFTPYEIYRSGWRNAHLDDLKAARDYIFTRVNRFDDMQANRYRAQNNFLRIIRNVGGFSEEAIGRRSSAYNALGDQQEFTPGNVNSSVGVVPALYANGVWERYSSRRELFGTLENYPFQWTPLQTEENRDIFLQTVEDVTINLIISNVVEKRQILRNLDSPNFQSEVVQDYEGEDDWNATITKILLNIINDNTRGDLNRGRMLAEAPRSKKWDRFFDLEHLEFDHRLDQLNHIIDHLMKDLLNYRELSEEEALYWSPIVNEIDNQVDSLKIDASQKNDRGQYRKAEEKEAAAKVGPWAPMVSKLEELSRSIKEGTVGNEEIAQQAREFQAFARQRHPKAGEKKPASQRGLPDRLYELGESLIQIPAEEINGNQDILKRIQFILNAIGGRYDFLGLSSDSGQTVEDRLKDSTQQRSQRSPVNPGEQGRSSTTPIQIRLVNAHAENQKGVQYRNHPVQSSEAQPDPADYFEVTANQEVKNFEEYGIAIGEYGPIEVGAFVDAEVLKDQNIVLRPKGASLRIIASNAISLEDLKHWRKEAIVFDLSAIDKDGDVIRIYEPGNFITPAVEVNVPSGIEQNEVLIFEGEQSEEGIIKGERRQIDKRNAQRFIQGSSLQDFLQAQDASSFLQELDSIKAGMRSSLTLKYVVEEISDQKQEGILSIENVAALAKKIDSGLANRSSEKAAAELARILNNHSQPAVLVINELFIKHELKPVAVHPQILAGIIHGAQKEKKLTSPLARSLSRMMNPQGNSDIESLADVLSEKGFETAASFLDPAWLEIMDQTHQMRSLESDLQQGEDLAVKAVVLARDQSPNQNPMSPEAPVLARDVFDYAHQQFEKILLADPQAHIVIQPNGQWVEHQKQIDPEGYTIIERGDEKRLIDIKEQKEHQQRRARVSALLAGMTALGGMAGGLRRRSREEDETEAEQDPSPEVADGLDFNLALLQWVSSEIKRRKHNDLLNKEELIDWVQKINPDLKTEDETTILKIFVRILDDIGHHSSAKDVNDFLEDQQEGIILTVLNLLAAEIRRNEEPWSVESAAAMARQWDPNLADVSNQQAVREFTRSLDEEGYVEESILMNNVLRSASFEPINSKIEQVARRFIQRYQAYLEGREPDLELDNIRDLANILDFVDQMSSYENLARRIATLFKQSGHQVLARQIDGVLEPGQRRPTIEQVGEEIRYFDQQQSLSYEMIYRLAALRNPQMIGQNEFLVIRKLKEEFQLVGDVESVVLVEQIFNTAEQDQKNALELHDPKKQFKEIKTFNLNEAAEAIKNQELDYHRILEIAVLWNQKYAGQELKAIQALAKALFEQGYFTQVATIKKMLEQNGFKLDMASVDEAGDDSSDSDQSGGTGVEDEAQPKSTTTGPKRKGGIDLNPEMFETQILRDPNGAPLPMEQQLPAIHMQIEGFIPVIIQSSPVIIPLLLGLGEVGPDQKRQAQKADSKDPAVLSSSDGNTSTDQEIVYARHVAQ